MAVDPNGNITLAWPQNGHVVVTTKSTSASVWPAQQQLDTLSNGSIGQIAIAAGSSGTTVTWMQTATGGQPTIQAARLNSNLTSWSAATRLDAAPSGAQAPAIAVDNAGFVDVCYAESDGIFLIRYSPTTSSWSQPIQMNTVPALFPPVYTQSLAMAVDGAGNVLLVYNTSASTIYSSTYLTSTGAVVGSVAALDTGFMPSAFVPSVVFGPDNAAIATYLTTANPTFGPVRAFRLQ